MIFEGNAKFQAIGAFTQGPGKAGNGFYNREMVTSRDFTVSILKIFRPGLALDGMAGTGIRGIRIALESGWEVVLNDNNPVNFNLIKDNVKLNGLNSLVWNLDFNAAVAEKFWDYIDIDPYGTPVGFVENSLAHLKNHGILGVTMTDTSVLEGKFLQKGYLRYGGFGLRGIYSKEVSTRIFAAYLIKIAASLELGSRVLLTIRDKHYIRVFLQVQRGVNRALKSLENVKNFTLEGKTIGPLYWGPLYDNEVLDRIDIENLSSRSKKLFENMKNEDLMLFFYTNSINNHEVSINEIIERIKERGYRAGRTNFYEKGIKTDAPNDLYYSILQEADSNKFI